MDNMALLSRGPWEAALPKQGPTAYMADLALRNPAKGSAVPAGLWTDSALPQEALGTGDAVPGRGL